MQYGECEKKIIKCSQRGSGGKSEREQAIGRILFKSNWPLVSIPDHIRRIALVYKFWNFPTNRLQSLFETAKFCAGIISLCSYYWFITLATFIWWHNAHNIYIYYVLVSTSYACNLRCYCTVACSRGVRCTCILCMPTFQEFRIASNLLQCNGFPSSLLANDDRRRLWRCTWNFFH